MIKDLIRKYLAFDIIPMRTLFKILSFDVITKSLPFLLLPIYLKVINQSEFGLYSQITQITIISLSVFTFGIENVWASFFYEKNKNQVGKLIGSTGIIVLFINLIIFSVGLLLYKQAFFSNFLNPDSNGKLSTQNIIFVLLVSICGAVINIFLITYFQLKEKIGIYLKLNLFKVLLATISFFLLHKYIIHKGLFRNLLESISIFLIFLFPIYKIIVKEKPQVDKMLIKRILLISFPFFINAIANIIYGLTDKLTIQSKLGLEVLGTYNLCLYLLLPLGFILGSFNQLWLPIFFKESDILVNYNKTKSSIKKMQNIYIILGVILWIGLIMAIKVGILKNIYASSIYLFPILLIAKTFEAKTSIYISLLLQIKKMWTYTIVQFSIGAILVISNLLIVKKFGVYGIALSVCIAALIRFLIIYYVSKKYIFESRKN